MILVACSKSALMDHLKTREISEFENTQNIRSLEDGRVALWPFSVATSLIHDMQLAPTPAASPADESRGRYDSMQPSITMPKHLNFCLFCSAVATGRYSFT